MATKKNELILKSKNLNKKEKKLRSIEKQMLIELSKIEKSQKNLINYNLTISDKLKDYDKISYNIFKSKKEHNAIMKKKLDSSAIKHLEKLSDERFINIMKKEKLLEKNRTLISKRKDIDVKIMTLNRKLLVLIEKIKKNILKQKHNISNNRKNNKEIFKLIQKQKMILSYRKKNRSIIEKTIYKREAIISEQEKILKQQKFLLKKMES